MSAPPPFTIACGTTNPSKLAAVQAAFDRAFPGRLHSVEGFPAASLVPAQPWGDAQTRLGARNRAEGAAALCEASRGSLPDFAVGLEGGCDIEEGEGGDVVASVTCFAHMVVMQPRSRRCGHARTATFVLPPPVAALMLGPEKLELGDADDRVFGRSNSKQKNGAVGLLTGDRITRAAYYEHALILALVPFLEGNEGYYLAQ